FKPHNFQLFDLFFTPGQAKAETHHFPATAAWSQKARRLSPSRSLLKPDLRWKVFLIRRSPRGSNPPAGRVQDNGNRGRSPRNRSDGSSDRICPAADLSVARSPCPWGVPEARGR